jgi:hypothetical protein
MRSYADRLLADAAQDGVQPGILSWAEACQEVDEVSCVFSSRDVRFVLHTLNEK